jgi:L-rhamnose mutarotase
MTRYCFTLQVRAAMAGTEVNARWQAELAQFFIGTDNAAPDEAFTLLTEVFYLPTALAAAEGT